jgi:hypothetical protein
MIVIFVLLISLATRELDKAVAMTFGDLRRRVNG